jgi:hypothetical protein
MPYWFLNKKTGEARVFGSRSPILEATELTANELEYIFVKKKLLEFETDQYRIVRVDLERGGKGKHQPPTE